MKRSGGFSLVELMVAMTLGLVVILGGGQLFFSVLQVSRQVDALSDRQAAVNFAIESLLGDVRRARHDPGVAPWDAAHGVLTLTVPNRFDVASDECAPGEAVTKEYRLSVASDGEALLRVGISCVGSAAPPVVDDVVGGFVAPDDAAGPGFAVDDTGWGDGVLVVTLRLVPVDSAAEAETLSFLAVNRTAVLVD